MAPADGLVPWVARSSAAMILSVQEKQALGFHKGGFLWPVIILLLRNYRKWKYVLMFPGIDSAQQGLTHCGLVTPYGKIYLGQHWLR